ncbi:uncharacterized protein APUU_70216A [Aspergillus puulaauensis]|uniref:Short-chain dehydrogenase n=1 Tax=Aspergillus puulaauensis TaxID=1220207 RepID=A0A7R8ARN6_9EURO|nr:uncharacterized protein APUU_70216A [Aspergillus puulaauensis]BCS28646.1 hypothetical protein APUU_70216A [Aspergillus puulaauensis]
MGGFWSSPAPPLTEANLQDQTGKVFIVTGATSGYGLLLARILYRRNGKVYLAARDTAKLQQVADDLKHDFPNSAGEVDFFHLDLSDLSTIKISADAFLAKESQLHALWHNAGVMIPPQGSKTKQGYELQLGTNNIGPFLLTKLLVAPRAPTPAIDFTNLDYHNDEWAWVKYGRSKAGNVLQAAALARRAKDDGIASLALDPGVAITGLQRTMSGWLLVIIRLISQRPEIGAYTQLYAGLQPDLDVQQPETWGKPGNLPRIARLLTSAAVVPPGKLVGGRADLFDGEASEKFWQWNEEQIKPYV